MSDPVGETSEPPAKRRKVRKGTRSCWECRRRKIKCQLDSPEDAICIGCKQRGTVCRSQELPDDSAPEPGHKSDPPLTRRLDRLEQMMERLVDKIVPDETDAAGPSSSQPQHARRSFSGSLHAAPPTERRRSSVDILETTVASEGPAAALLAMRHESVHRRGPSESEQIPAPVLTSVDSVTPIVNAAMASQGGTSRPGTRTGGILLPPLNKHFWVCNTLRKILPPKSAIDAILEASPGAPSALAMCYSEAERREGRPESPSSVSMLPTLTAHPLLLAKRALQVLICIQQLPPGFDWDILGTDAPLNDTMNRLSNTSTLVTSNDELIGYAEGVECLILQGYYQVNGGNLRKAWITARRALSLAQMIGINQGRSVAFRSCDPNVNPHKRASAEALWSKVISWERYLSLLLGLPICSQSVDVTTKMDSINSIDCLEKTHAAISARIVERNASHRKDATRHLSIYARTQEIDLELEAAARIMPSNWWDGPRFDSLGDQELLWDTTIRILVQIHHFTLVLLLHVPYMLRDLESPRYDYSKTTCMAAARDLLSRFITYRTHSVSAYSCRSVDYAGLIASMTLCLSYLGKRSSETWEHGRVREDVLLVDSAKSQMENTARMSGDRLSKDASSIMEQLVLIVERAAGDAGGASSLEETQRGTLRDMQFKVPFMGIVSIKLPRGSAVPSAEWQGGHRRHRSSATGALERMALGSPTQQQRVSVSSIETGISAPSDVGLLQFAPYDDQAPSRHSSMNLPGMEQHPDLMADGEEWPLQGVDAAYWSLFEGTGI